MISLKKNNIGVFILAYKRLKHLKKTIFYLKKNIHKKDTIYIFMDNYSSDQSKKDINEIKKVKIFLSQLSKKKYKVIFRKKRFGMKKNWISAYNFMFKKYNKVICLEDDIIINKNFIKFMTYYLNHYEKNKKIMNITGFSTKINLPKDYKYDCFLTKRSMSWGQGSWRRVWKKFSLIKESHKQILLNNNNKYKLISAGQDLLRTMTLDHFKFAESIQVWWIWNILRNEGYSINPVKTLVNNIGYDGTGYHSKIGDSFPKNYGNFVKHQKMNKIFYLESINTEFVSKFQIKKLTFLLFKYLPLFILYSLFLLKKFIKKK